ncbi:ABC transporter substrate-binding protein [Brasilonema sp. UFV-L1]|uniref:ABC transporter substrate-binding protein n=1 Tax=Brasilonema sp. UFV-L1 TaxID=2234130 RepID=UPI00145DBB97|nr:ABC transporter substrate-binding protein [Brasilonema sp. UFV-L1]NMG11208.1 ABC transporter substrate-binding protein [Brasilonema sp. UFV-L1]
MQRRIILFGLILWLSLVTFACTNVTTGQAQNIDTSPTSRSQQSQQSVKRIVTLTSLSSDIISQLDNTKLVGITGSDLFKNVSRFKDIPRVSQGQATPNLEKIVALKPDLVIGASGFSNLTTDKLKELGITTLLTKVDNWEALQNLTKTLAKMVNADATSLLNRYQTFLPEKQTQHPYTLVLVSRQPILSPSRKSWAGSLLEKFEAQNVSADLQGKISIPGYVTLSAEKVLEANPEVLIVVSPQPGLLKSFKSESFWDKLKATKNNRVYEFDYYGLVNPGSIDAIEKACQQLKVALSK